MSEFKNLSHKSVHNNTFVVVTFFVSFFLNKIKSSHFSLLFFTPLCFFTCVEKRDPLSPFNYDDDDAKLLLVLLQNRAKQHTPWLFLGSKQSAETRGDVHEEESSKTPPFAKTTPPFSRPSSVRRE